MIIFYIPRVSLYLPNDDSYCFSCVLCLQGAITYSLQLKQCKYIVKILAGRETDSCGYPRDGSIDRPAFVETKNVFYSRLKSAIGISAAIFQIFPAMCCFYLPSTAAGILPAVLSICLLSYCQCIFSMVPGKISDRSLDWPSQLLCLGQVSHASQTTEQTIGWLSQLYQQFQSFLAREG